MIIRQLAALSAAIFPLIAFAQIEFIDSLSLDTTPTDSIIHLKTYDKVDSLSVHDASLEHHWICNLSLDPLSPYSYPLGLHVPDLHFAPGQSILFNWKDGEILSTGGMTSLPGMMHIERGSFGIYQSVDKFTLYVGGIANKYGYFRGLSVQYGLDGNLAYRISPHLSFSVFGTHYFGQAPLMANGMPMPPSMIGYYARSKYGGTFDYQINNHWGIEAGAQTVKQFGTNRYETEPIATPYYKISGKVKIGLPVGQILYHILKR